MDKTLVEVYVPLLRNAYDILIPRNVQLFDVLELVKKAIIELSEGRFIPNANTVICSRETGKIFDINKSADELGIKNGSMLMLI